MSFYVLFDFNENFIFSYLFEKKKDCKKLHEAEQGTSKQGSKEDQLASNVPMCEICKKPLPKTPIEILRHKKKCSVNVNDEKIE